MAGVIARWRRPFFPPYGTAVANVLKMIPGRPVRCNRGVSIEALLTVAAFAALAIWPATAVWADDDIAERQARREYRDALDRAETDFQAARAACTQAAEDQRESCRDQARSTYRIRRADARASYRSSAGHDTESNEDRREREYAAARERCDAYRGEAEDRCVEDARALYRH